MKRQSGPPKQFAPTLLRRHESVKLVVAISLVLGAAFAACGIDDSNSPLKNEAPNRGKFVGGIAIGAGPMGTGGSGAGLGSGGSTSIGGSGGGALSACQCATAIANSACQNCLEMSCDTDETTCTTDSTAVCSSMLTTLEQGGCTDSTCITTDLLNPLFAALATCACTTCASSCNTPTVACP
jgi:hypothetical protein